MMGTRTVATPTCSLYSTTLYRRYRTWNDNATSPSDADYKYDYGFVLNRRKDFLASGDVNNITPGWSINCDATEGDLRTHQNTAYSRGPRVLQMNDSHVDGLDNMSVTKAFYFRNLAVDNNTTPPHGAFSDSYICFGEDPEYPLHIGDDNITIHVPLASRNSGELSFRLTLDRRDGDTWTEIKTQDVTVETAYATSSETQNGVLFKDVTLNFNAGWAGGNFRLKVQILTVGWKQAFCAGYIVEQKGNNPAFSETVENGNVRYTDVRGGSVYRYHNNVLFEGQTFRPNGGILNYSYRTYDTRKMDYSNGKDGIAGGYIGRFYIIDGDDGNAIKEEQPDKIKYRDMFPLYGMYKSTINNRWKGSPFHEGDNHIDPFFSDDDFHRATDFEMKKDAQVITLGAINSEAVHYDGSVRAKLVGIGTGWNNDIGYFYYPKSEEGNLMVRQSNGELALDINKVPKVIIRKNMQDALAGQQPNADNIAEDGASMAYWGVGSQQYNRYVNGCAALSLEDSDIDELLTTPNFQRDDVPKMITNLRNNPVKRAAAVEATFDAPIYKLPFFGWQANSDGKYEPTGTATYVWPADYVIGFFGIRTDDHVACELSRIYTTSASVQRNYFNDLPRGSAFSYKGKNYIGLEDEWDYDNNDFLFEVQGVQSVDPDITPEDDPVSDKNTQSWVIACEDLGGTWDYDFNDLVWAVTKEVVTTTQGSNTWGTTDLYFRALAAGGTLEAIVEYNTSMVLEPANDDPNWIQLGEIHNLVKRTSSSKNSNDEYETSTGTQLNVTLGHNPELSEVGNRIKLGSTIPTNSSDITMENILTHFRVRVFYPSGESVIVRNVSNLQSAASSTHDHTTHDTKRDSEKAPQFILLPMGWRWPGEAVCISDAYPEFSNWAQERGNYPNWLNVWNNHVATNKVIENPLK